MSILVNYWKLPTNGAEEKGTTLQRVNWFAGCNKKANQQTSVYPEKKQAPFATTDYYIPLRTVQMEAEMEDSNNPDSEE